eukprot:11516086-Alexandrium_andersonii.AAC.1
MPLAFLVGGSRRVPNDLSSRPSSASPEPGPAPEDSDSPKSSGPPSGYKVVPSTSYSPKLCRCAKKNAEENGLTGSAASGPPAG